MYFKWNVYPGQTKRTPVKWILSQRGIWVYNNWLFDFVEIEVFLYA